MTSPSISTEADTCTVADSTAWAIANPRPMGTSNASTAICRPVPPSSPPAMPMITRETPHAMTAGATSWDFAAVLGEAMQDSRDEAAAEAVERGQDAEVVRLVAEFIGDRRQQLGDRHRQKGQDDDQPERQKNGRLLAGIAQGVTQSYPLDLPAVLRRSRRDMTDHDHQRHVGEGVEEEHPP